MHVVADVYAKSRGHTDNLDKTLFGVQNPTSLLILSSSLLTLALEPGISATVGGNTAAIGRNHNTIPNHQVMTSKNRVEG